MKVAVIGLGWMGKIHLRIYSEMVGTYVVGVVDPDPEVRKFAHENYGVAVYDTVEELLENELDAVSVCVPTTLHHEVGMKVIEKDIPLIIEKPLAVTYAQAKDLVDAANKNQVTLMVGHVERFNPVVQKVKELVKENTAISIFIERVGPYPPRIQDVGVIRDLGAHDIDLVRHLSGSEYKSVFAVTSTTIGKHEDTALITSEMENGVLGQINTNWVTPYKSRHIRVAMREGYIEANLITQQVKQYSRFVSYDQSYSVREWPIMYKEPVKEELNAFLGAIRNGTTPPITGDDGLIVIKTIEDIIEGGCNASFNGK